MLTFGISFEVHQLDREDWKILDRTPKRKSEVGGAKVKAVTVIGIDI